MSNGGVEIGMSPLTQRISPVGDREIGVSTHVAGDRATLVRKNIADKRDRIKKNPFLEENGF